MSVGTSRGKSRSPFSRCYPPTWQAVAFSLYPFPARSILFPLVSERGVFRDALPGLVQSSRESDLLAEAQARYPEAEGPAVQDSTDQGGNIQGKDARRVLV